MKLQEILLKNKTINDPDKIEFIMYCFHQLGGAPGIAKSVSETGLYESAKTIEKLINDNSSIKLDLRHTSLETLKEICISIIKSLDEYGDLEIVMSITRQEAEATIIAEL